MIGMLHKFKRKYIEKIWNSELNCRKIEVVDVILPELRLQQRRWFRVPNFLNVVSFELM